MGSGGTPGSPAVCLPNGPINESSRKTATKYISRVEAVTAEVHTREKAAFGEDGDQAEEDEDRWGQALEFEEERAGAESDHDRGAQ